MAKKNSGRHASRSVGDYLKAIYMIGGEKGLVATGALAERLGIAPASATNMMKKLAASAPPLVVYSKSRGAALTAEGRRIALDRIRRHRLIERFLHDQLGCGWDEVHEEAERLEHAVSDRLMDRIEERLGHPAVDPHGDPIPSKNGSLEVPDELLLVDLAPGVHAVVSRVPDGDPPLLRSLAEAGIVPGARLVVPERAARGGALRIRVGRGGRTRILPRRIAGRVRVALKKSRAKALSEAVRPRREKKR
ncbi:MAG: metal-dependent transcriptional regulator [Candidatus Eisenbacteria bacterium]|nr:metal-dependent transcriptional regulator [Candidatus Eisenbacteria bacterium]